MGSSHPGGAPLARGMGGGEHPFPAPHLLPWVLWHDCTLLPLCHLLLASQRALCSPLRPFISSLSSLPPFGLTCSGGHSHRPQCPGWAASPAPPMGTPVPEPVCPWSCLSPPAQRPQPSSCSRRRPAWALPLFCSALRGACLPCKNFPSLERASRRVRLLWFQVGPGKCIH